MQRLYLSTFADECGSAIAVCCLFNDILSQKKKPVFTNSNFPTPVYRRAFNLGILHDPGSEVEDRQYQIDLQSINIGTAQWEHLKPEKEGAKGGASVENERSSQNPALEWNMASRSELAESSDDQKTTDEQPALCCLVVNLILTVRILNVINSRQ